MKYFFVRWLVLVKANVFTIDYLDADYSQCSMVLYVATKWNHCEGRHSDMAENNWKNSKELLVIFCFNNQFKTKLKSRQLFCSFGFMFMLSTCRY